MATAPGTEQSPALVRVLSSTPPRAIGFKQAFGFGAGDFYGGGQLVMVATYMSLFWTRFGDLNIQTAQGLIGVGTIISGFAALVFGILSDNLYRFRIGRMFGRRRLLLLILSPLLLSGILLWIPHQPLAVYACVFVLWVILAQLFQAAYNPLPGEMSKDFNERTKLSTVRLFISTAATTVIPLGCSAVLSIFGEDGPFAYQLFAITTTVLFSCAVFIAWKSTWEMTPEQAGFPSAVYENRPKRLIGPALWLRGTRTILHEYASTLRLSVFRKHLGIYLLIQIAMDVFGQTFVFFVMFDWNRTAAFASLLLGCSVISLPLMPLFGWLITAIGPKRVYAFNFAGCIFGILWLGAAWLLQPMMPGIVWVVFAVSGSLVFFAFKALCGFIPWAIFPFISDVDQVVSARYRASTFSGVQAFFRQIGSGLAVMFVGAVLGWCGFDSRLAHQSSSAVIGLAAVALGWFIVSMIAAWIISSHLTLDKHTDYLVLAEIVRLRNGGKKEEVDAETRRTVETLTGLSYERCWQKR